MDHSTIQTEIRNYLWDRYSEAHKQYANQFLRIQVPRNQLEKSKLSIEEFPSINLKHPRKLIHDLHREFPADPLYIAVTQFLEIIDSVYEKLKIKSFMALKEPYPEDQIDFRPRSETLLELTQFLQKSNLYHYDDFTRLFDRILEVYSLPNR